MSIEPNEIFEFMQCAYRNGVMEKFMAVKAQALDAAMDAAGLNMGDLWNRMDDAKEETVLKIDKLLDKAGPFVKYATNDRLMRFVSRLLDISLIKHWVIKFMKRSLLKVMTGTKPPSLLDRAKSVLALKTTGYGGMKNG